MWRILQMLLTAWLTAAAFGCASGPLLDNPIRVGLDRTASVENPVYIPLGPQSYGQVFEKVLDIVDDYFPIAVENRYDGRIETFPRIAPGLEQLWKEGSPDAYQRLLATFQTLRHRAVLLIQAAEDGGYFVQVTVYREEEDLPRPTRDLGNAIFSANPTLEREFEVIDPTVFESNWIPMGRDTALEQEILQRIKNCM